MFKNTILPLFDKCPGSSQLAFPPAVNDDEEAGLSEELLEDGGEDETGGDARRRSHDKVYGDQTAPNRKLDNGRSRSKGIFQKNLSRTN